MSQQCIIFERDHLEVSGNKETLCQGRTAFVSIRHCMSCEDHIASKQYCVHVNNE